VFTARYGLNIYISWLRRLIAVLSLRRPGFIPLSVHLSFMEDKVTPEQVFLEFLLFSLVSKPASLKKCNTVSEILGTLD